MTIGNFFRCIVATFLRFSVRNGRKPVENCRNTVSTFWRLLVCSCQSHPAFFDLEHSSQVEKYGKRPTEKNRKSKGLSNEGIRPTGRTRFVLEPTESRKKLTEGYGHRILLVEFLTFQDWFRSEPVRSLEVFVGNSRATASRILDRRSRCFGVPGCSN